MLIIVQMLTNNICIGFVLIQIFGLKTVQRWALVTTETETNALAPSPLQMS